MIMSCARPGTLDPSRLKGERAMLDVILIVVGCGCFAVGIAYAYACDGCEESNHADRITGSAPP